VVPYAPFIFVKHIDDSKRKIPSFPHPNITKNCFGGDANDCCVIHNLSATCLVKLRFVQFSTKLNLWRNKVPWSSGKRQSPRVLSNVPIDCVQCVHSFQNFIVLSDIKALAHYHDKYYTFTNEILSVHCSHVSTHFALL